MNTPTILLTAVLLTGGAFAETPAPRNVSLKLEVQRAIDAGIEWLKKNQGEDGTWSTNQVPAITSLALRGVAGNPSRQPGEPMPEWTKKSFDYLLSNQKPDGGIYIEGLATYNTSIGLMALVAAGDPAHDEAIRKARRFLIGQQADFGKKGETDSPVDGGIGYGGSLEHSDMSNTHFALEALYHANKRLEADGKATDDVDLDWEAALTFVSRCQNLPATNDQPWASDNAEDRGGFVYTPYESKAGETQLPGGRSGLRSYGSMSYAGFLSLVYADLKPDDPRVEAVKDWVSRNYTLEENPNMGPQGLFYYFHTMAKALNAAGMTELETPDGKVDWREKLALRLIDLQQADGSWFNKDSKRWMEGDAALVTAYALVALQNIYFLL